MTTFCLFQSSVFEKFPSPQVHEAPSCLPTYRSLLVVGPTAHRGARTTLVFSGGPDDRRSVRSNMVQGVRTCGRRKGTRCHLPFGQPQQNCGQVSETFINQDFLIKIRLNQSSHRGVGISHKSLLPVRALWRHFIGGGCHALGTIRATPIRIVGAVDATYIRKGHRHFSLASHGHHSHHILGAHHVRVRLEEESPHNPHSHGGGEEDQGPRGARDSHRKSHRQAAGLPLLLAQRDAASLTHDVDWQAELGDDDNFDVCKSRPRGHHHRRGRWGRRAGGGRE